MENFNPSKNTEASVKGNSAEIIDKNYSNSSFENLSEDPFSTISQTEFLNLAENNPELTPLVESFLKSSEIYVDNFWENYQANLNGTYSESADTSAEVSIDTLSSNLGEIINSLQTNQKEIPSWASNLLNESEGIDKNACGELAIVLWYQKYLDKREKDEVVVM